MSLKDKAHFGRKFDSKFGGTHIEVIGNPTEKYEDKNWYLEDDLKESLDACKKEIKSLQEENERQCDIMCGALCEYDHSGRIDGLEEALAILEKHLSL